MAIKVNGTTVINDSRALSNIASIDATTVAALGAAGVGGGDVTEEVVTWNTHAAFTKPADALNNLTFSDGVRSSAPPSNKRIIQTPALTSGATGSVVFYLPTPSVYAQRAGGYWGTGIYCVHYDASASLWKLLHSFGSWPSQITWPQTSPAASLISYGVGDRFEIYATDLYDGGGSSGTIQYNDNLSFNANTVSVKLSKLVV